MVRKDLPDLGYPHQSPEQERVPGRNCCFIPDEHIHPEDRQVIELIIAMPKRKRDIAYLSWSKNKTIPDISSELRMKQGRVKYAIESIQDSVADKVLL